MGAAMLEAERKVTVVQESLRNEDRVEGETLTPGESMKGDLDAPRSSGGRD